MDHTIKKHSIKITFNDDTVHNAHPFLSTRHDGKEARLNSASMSKPRNQGVLELFWMESKMSIINIPRSVLQIVTSNSLLNLSTTVFIIIFIYINSGGGAAGGGAIICLVVVHRTSDHGGGSDHHYFSEHCTNNCKPRVVQHQATYIHAKKQFIPKYPMDQATHVFYPPCNCNSPGWTVACTDLHSIQYY